MPENVFFPRTLCIGLLALFGLAMQEVRADEGISRRELAQAIDALVEEARAKGPIAGISVGISIDGEVVHARGYGFADLENDVPAT